MPRPPVPTTTVACVIQTYTRLTGFQHLLDGHRRRIKRGRRPLDQILTPTAENVHAMVKDRLQEQAPSVRTVGHILAEHRQHIRYVNNDPPIKALSPGWVTDPDDIAYIAALDRLAAKDKAKVDRLYAPYSDRWTSTMLAAALELKALLGWPWDQSGSGPVMRVCPLVLIEEMACRRTIASNIGQEARYDDIYDILLGGVSEAEASVLRTAKVDPVAGEAPDGILRYDIFMEGIADSPPLSISRVLMDGFVTVRRVDNGR